MSGGIKISSLSKPICLRHAFTMSISTTNCSIFSCRGSKRACHVILCACTSFSYSLRFFLYAIVLIFSGNAIVLYRCLTSAIAVCNLSSFPCSSCRIPYSNNQVHIWSLFSSSSTTLWMFCMMFSVVTVTSFSLCTQTLGVVIGTARSSSSLIFSLYCCRVYTIFVIFSYEYVSSDTVSFEID
jgi:hypothetical protein